jgi:hypothetical protein
MPSIHPHRAAPAGARRRLATAGLLAVALTAAIAFAAPPAALGATGGDWPCVQRKVARLSIGQMWNGPEATGDWQADPEIRDLALALASRRLPVEEAAPLIDAFADKAGAARAAKLPLLFAGVFEVIDRDRATVVAGIERYSKRQQALAARIGEESLKIAELKRSGDTTNAVLDKIEDQEAALGWDTRIYEEREQSLTYVCEVPVLYEQRAFAIAKLIQAKLD